MSWISQGEEFTGRGVGAAEQAEGCPHRHVSACEGGKADCGEDRLGVVGYSGSPIPKARRTGA